MGVARLFSAVKDKQIKDQEMLRPDGSNDAVILDCNALVHDYCTKHFCEDRTRGTKCNLLSDARYEDLRLDLLDDLDLLIQTNAEVFAFFDGSCAAQGKVREIAARDLQHGTQTFRSREDTLQELAPKVANNDLGYWDRVNLNSALHADDVTVHMAYLVDDVYRHLEDMGIPVDTDPVVEADTLCSKFIREHEDEYDRFIIVTNDSDFMLISVKGYVADFTYLVKHYCRGRTTRATNLMTHLARYPTHNDLSLEVRAVLAGALAGNDSTKVLPDGESYEVMDYFKAFRIMGGGDWPSHFNTPHLIAGAHTTLVIEGLPAPAGLPPAPAGRVPIYPTVEEYVEAHPVFALPEMARVRDMLLERTREYPYHVVRGVTNQVDYPPTPWSIKSLKFVVDLVLNAPFPKGHHPATLAAFAKIVPKLIGIDITRPATSDSLTSVAIPGAEGVDLMLRDMLFGVFVGLGYIGANDTPALWTNAANLSTVVLNMVRRMISDDIRHTIVATCAAQTINFLGAHMFSAEGHLRRDTAVATIHIIEAAATNWNAALGDDVGWRTRDAVTQGLMTMASTLPSPCFKVGLNIYRSLYRMSHLLATHYGGDFTREGEVGFVAQNAMLTALLGAKTLRQPGLWN